MLCFVFKNLNAPMIVSWEKMVRVDFMASNWL